jgi:hypothetical protein
MESAWDPGDLLGVSLFRILCSCPVHHYPAAVVVLTISVTNTAGTFLIICFSRSLAQGLIFHIRLFFQKYTVVVGPVALMSVVCFHTSEHAYQGFCMS